jgi:hypothetical protein
MIRTGCLGEQERSVPKSSPHTLSLFREPSIYGVQSSLCGIDRSTKVTVFFLGTIHMVRNLGLCHRTIMWQCMDVNAVAAYLSVKIKSALCFAALSRQSFLYGEKGCRARKTHHLIRWHRVLLARIIHCPAGCGPVPIPTVEMLDTRCLRTYMCY